MRYYILSLSPLKQKSEMNTDESPDKFMVEPDFNVEAFQVNAINHNQFDTKGYIRRTSVGEKQFETLGVRV